MLRVTVSPVTLALDKKPLRKAMAKIGRQLVREARAEVKKAQGSGRVYVSQGKRAQASAPGQAPVSRSGELAKSIQWKARKGGLGGVLRARAYYAKMLEAGAQGGGRKGVRNSKRRTRSQQTTRVLLPRPFISTVVKRHEKTIGTQLQQGLQEAIKQQKGKRL